jgi:Type I phosphodiesterase / nucleotide pyrophosphatase
MADPDRDRVDVLREQLRALGYLDARVDRFVLGSAAGRERPVALAASASLRIGILAGVLLGPAAAIGLRSRAPGLVTSVSDAGVLALYLALFFGAAATLIAGVAILAAGLAARTASARPNFGERARRIAVLTGTGLGLACLLYLTLWWRTATGLGESGSIGWNAAVLAIAAAISLLLGHAVTVTVLAYLARLGAGAPLRAGLPLSSWKARVPLGAVAVVGALTLLVATAPHAAGTPTAPPLTIVPTGRRVVVIGIDGVDGTTLARLSAAGRLPVLERMTGQAVATLPSTPDRDPASVWTTIATGQDPERHGVRALESRQVAGLGGRLRPASPGWSALTAATDLVRLTAPAIASGDERLLPTFWEVAARAGLRTAVVHWWATWPASVDLGTVLSDRAILRLEHGGPLDGEIAPPALYDTLEQTWAERRARAAARAADVVPAGTSADVAAALRRSAELDATILDLAGDPALGDPDLLVVYLPGLDIAQHTLLGVSDATGLAPAGAAERVAALDRYYEFLDGLLAPLVTDAGGPSRFVLLVTQPGRVAGPGSGLLAVAGEGAGAARGTAKVTAVAATVLEALGVPIAQDLAAGPVLDLFSVEFVAAHPVRDVDTYGSRGATSRRGTGKPLDREMIDRMRSLGYVR